MHRRTAGKDLSTIAGHLWVNPIIVDVAIERFDPYPGERETDTVLPPG